ncbi:MAG: alpha/beta hydrolase fold domain-containing protein [Parasporobacterium sp.]|nr:alpha/beta hydrolase fold domain-containing protein [Parasporobacterium sp.]
MKKEERTAVINKLLPEILENAAATRKANQIVPVSGTRYTLPLEGRDIDIVYYPAASVKAPLIVGLHGGGFLFGGCALDDDLWVQVTGCLDVNVASVDYRMSPEVKDYDALYDSYDSLLYLKAHADEFGFDPQHISVMGSSAGGNLAAAVCLLANREGTIQLDNQILMYPFLDGATDPDLKGEGSFSGILPHIMNYLHFSEDKAKDPLLSPVFAGADLMKGLPNAVVSYCEEDNLRPEAIVYCSNLRAAGVPVSEFFAELMPHGYIESGFKTEFTEMDLQMLGDHAKELVEGGLLRKRSEETLAFVKDHFVC